MNYVIQASDFEANSLLRTAQGHFDMVRQNPFLRAELLQQGFLEFELESGLMLRLAIEETFVRNVVVTGKQTANPTLQSCEPRPR